MTDENKDRRHVGAMERHLQTILIICVAAMLGWAGSTFMSSRDDSKEANLKLQMLTTEFREFKSSTSNQLGQIQGAMQAMQVSFATRAELRELEVRIREVETARTRTLRSLP